MLSEREKMCFELGMNLAKRICDDMKFENASNYLLNFMCKVNLNDTMNPDVLRKILVIQQEVINEFPQLWKRQS